ncbi:hypothetical protein AgCh_021110 [Apium graveolens]
MCVVDYPEWYDRVTRHFMINPGIWRDQQGFQGSQGLLPVAVEGLSTAYHQIHESGMAEDDDNVDEALQAMLVPVGQQLYLFRLHQLLGMVGSLGPVHQVERVFRYTPLPAQVGSIAFRGMDILTVPGTTLFREREIVIRLLGVTVHRCMILVGLFGGRTLRVMMRDFPQPTYSFPPETGGSGFSFQTPPRGFDPCESDDDYRSLRVSDPVEYFADVRQEWAFRREESESLTHNLIPMSVRVTLRHSLSIYPRPHENLPWSEFRRKVVKAVTFVEAHYWRGIDAGRRFIKCPDGACIYERWIEEPLEPRVAFLIEILREEITTENVAHSAEIRELQRELEESTRELQRMKAFIESHT